MLPCHLIRDDIAINVQNRRWEHGACFFGPRLFASRGPGKAVREDDKGLHEQQVSGIRALCLYRGHALRSLPIDVTAAHRNAEVAGAGLGRADARVAGLSRTSRRTHAAT